MSGLRAAGEPDILAALRLTMIPGIGPRLQRTLLDRFGTPTKVLAAAERELSSVPGIGPKILSAIADAKRDSAPAEEEFETCRNNGIDIVLRETDAYPGPLHEVPDSPLILYQRGAVYERDELAVAIVGSRNCTVYGRRQTERIAGGLARAGITIISGLARGIDSFAHHAAIKAGGRTIAVLGSGLLNIYPPEHEELAGDVAGAGAVVSEFPLHQRPSRGLFPQRNRIISGLSLAVIVIEARERSGALHTARHASEQGRQVFVVPGNVDTFASAGSHGLIRDGATLIRSPEDVLDDLGPLASPVKRTEAEEVHSPRELTLNEREREVLNLVSSDETPIEQILKTTDLAPATVLSTLTILEMKKLVRRLPGNHLIRTGH